MSQDKQIDYRSLLQEALLEMRSLRAELEANAQAKIEPIAIVGMACRFPGGANTPEEYWQLLRDGVSAIAQIPPERWAIDAYYDPDPEIPGKMYTRYGGFIDQVDQFDPQFFGISPREAIDMDPQQRLLLEVSYTALERAGQSPHELKGSRTGVFVGISFDDYAKFSLNSGDLTRIDAYSSLGNTRSIAVGRLSYVLGLQGPTMQLDTTCSSSLLAVHLACQSLRSGESNLALAGGVSLMLSPEPMIGFCKLKALAADGRCKTFDAKADGYVRGEGCGIVVLKRLSDALASGDRILALIRGSAVNHDGQSNGLTAPNGAAQEAVIRQAIANAQVKATQIQYVETHGTGTALGDPIEVLALGKVFTEGRAKNNPLRIGSVKTNVGHLEAAAGVASLIKVVLAMQHEHIPPQLHFQEPNPYIPWEKLPIAVPNQLTFWDATGERIAGISSFGMSGTNVHMILSSAESEVTNPELLIDRPLHLLTLSAKTKEPLQELVSSYEQYLTSNPSVSVADVCFTANTGRSHFEHRLAIIASSIASAREKLADWANLGITGIASTHKHPKIAFLFTGEGSQGDDMGRQLYCTQPTFRQAVNQCAQLLQPYLEQPLLEILYPSHPNSQIQLKLNQTAFAQPALFALEYALYKLWTSWGIQPDVVMGHSLGEYVAACVAGVFSLEDALKLVATRDRLMQAEFLEVANSIEYASPQMEFISTGKADVATPQYWCEQIKMPVLFADAIKTIAQSCNICIELGPKPMLELGRIPEASMLWLPLQPTPNFDWQTILSSLAQLYVHGVAIDWRGVEQDYQRRRVLLPTYPFARQQYWIEPPKPSVLSRHENLHPLLGQKLHLAKLETIHFQATIGQSSPAYLQEHQVFGTSIMPAAGYLEMALAAAVEVFQTNNLVLTNVVIHQALVLSSECPKTLQLILTPESKEYRFEIFSLATEDRDWILHASGKVGVAASRVAEVDLHSKQAECTESIEAATFYQTCRSQGIDYGNSLRAIAQLWRGTNAALGQIIPITASPDSSQHQETWSERLSSTTYTFHPILLDASLQVVGASLSDSQTLLPIGLERLTFYGGANDCLWSSVQLHGGKNSDSSLTADVQIFTPEGRVVAAIENLQLKPANPETLLGTQQSLPDWYKVEWRLQSRSDQHEDYLPSPIAIRNQLIPSLPQLVRQPELVTYRQRSIKPVDRRALIMAIA